MSDFNNWQPRFFVLQNGDLKTGLTGPYWQQILQTQNYAGEQFRIRNILNPSILLGSFKTSDNTIQPSLITAVETKTTLPNMALLTETDRLPTPSAPTAASVGVASGAAVSAKTGRRYLCLVNTSANWVSLAFGSETAVLYSGVTLAPLGGSYEMNAAQGNLTDLAVNAIASGAASNLAIQEA